MQCILTKIVILSWFLTIKPQDSEGWKVQETSDFQPRRWVVKTLRNDPWSAVNFARKHHLLVKRQIRGFGNYYELEEDPNGIQLRKRLPHQSLDFQLESQILWAEEQIGKVRDKREFIGNFNDELWSEEWYLHDTPFKRTQSKSSDLDLNVLPVYQMGFTGKGINIAVLDDGIEWDHDDLKDNYDPRLSWDCNENDPDPAPNTDRTFKNHHGTRCAGEIAMTANNSKCGVGIAYGSKIGGIKLLSDLVTDLTEAIALSHANDLIDIYTSSWGPSDDGRTLDGPGTLAQESIQNGIDKGRNGKGSIFIWASGNGHLSFDNCNCDGYANSIFTITVGSVSYDGTFPWYGEACPAMLSVTFSSDRKTTKRIVTTDLGNKCTDKHSGTSASAPLAAGLVGLALEANSNLTWRDVQYLIVYTSNPWPLLQNPGWYQNAAGRFYNVQFGFGLMDGQRLVEAALKWTNVGDRKTCSTTIRANRPLENLQHIYFKSCGSGTTMNFLEHVQVVVNIRGGHRGALQFELESPAGTNVQLLGLRKLDDSQQGFTNWTLTSVATWGENPVGTWILKIFYKAIGPVKPIKSYK